VELSAESAAIGLKRVRKKKKFFKKGIPSQPVRVSFLFWTHDSLILFVCQFIFIPFVSAISAFICYVSRSFAILYGLPLLRQVT
ncbi:Uncharacterized protein APZ42_009322, partial [Daphnia magna]